MPNIYELICPCCGNIYPYYLNGDYTKKLLNNKILYCFKCQKETIHIYIKERNFMLSRLTTYKKLGKKLTEKEEFILNLLNKEKEKKLLKKM